MGITNQQLTDLLETTLRDLPVIEFEVPDQKFMYETWGHPIITLIRAGQNVSVDLRIYYAIPLAWVLEWKRKWER